MIAKAADTSAAYENPLVPNARLQQIYLAMLHARMLACALPLRLRGNWTPGMEACLVGPSIDLGPNDLVSDALAGGVVEFLRGAGLDAVPQTGKVSKKSSLVVECGGAARLPAVPGIAERLWAAVGAAAAFQASAAKETGVVVAYVRRGEVSAALWRKVLGFAAQQELPILFVVMPGARGAGTLGSVSALALRSGVPGIPVDGDDAVAIYRVAQESIGRARTGDGAVVMECVPFALHGVKSKRRNNAILAIEEYMLHRKVCTRAWLDRAAAAFAERLERRKK